MLNIAPRCNWKEWIICLFLLPNQQRQEVNRNTISFVLPFPPDLCISIIPKSENPILTLLVFLWVIQGSLTVIGAIFSIKKFRCFHVSRVISGKFLQNLKKRKIWNFWILVLLWAWGGWCGIGWPWPPVALPPPQSLHYSSSGAQKNDSIFGKWTLQQSVVYLHLHLQFFCNWLTNLNDGLVLRLRLQLWRPDWCDAGHGPWE